MEMNRNLSKNDHPLNTSGCEEEIDESILESFRFAEGRRFHKVDVPYFLANDEEEILRLQMHHCLYSHIWQSIYSSPMHEILLSERLTRVLDSGCGPGSWILDMADTYKTSSFVGVDLSPSMFPSSRNESTPDNVVFLERNIIDGFPFPNESFDFVRQGFMNFSFTKKHWQDVILDMIRITKPGGWIEFMEPEIETYFAGPLTKKFMKSFHDLLNTRGLDPFIATRIEEYLKSTNKVVDIHVESKATPLGSSQNQLIGELLSSNTWASLSHTKAYICKFMDIPIDEYDDFVGRIEKEYDDNKSYIKSYRIYGRKL